MASILDLIRQSGISVERCQRHTLDAEDFLPLPEGTSDQTESVFENPKPGQAIQTLKPLGAGLPTALRYFIDGSRRVQKVADIVFGGRFFPMVAGQIGVAVTERAPDTGKTCPLRDFVTIQNLIALPNRLHDEVPDIQARLDAQHPVAFRVVEYETGHADRNPHDLAVIKIMEEMLTCEIDTVVRLADSGRLGPDRMLVRDGPLQFRRTIPKLAAYEHVIGLSKTFSTNAPLKRGARPLDVGSLTKDLDLYDRTQCYRLQMSDKSIGFWYLRLHPHNRMPNPLDGVVKVEKIIQTYETDGVERERVDVLSQYLFEERNVTPYSTDHRWANHIYPVYLTERFLKASLESDLKFGGYFREIR